MRETEFGKETEMVYSIETLQENMAEIKKLRFPITRLTRDGAINALVYELNRHIRKETFPGATEAKWMPCTFCPHDAISLVVNHKGTGEKEEYTLVCVEWDYGSEYSITDALILQPCNALALTAALAKHMQRRAAYA